MTTNDTMKHAIDILQQHLGNAEINEPIHRAEGNTAQADLALEVAADIRNAISCLRIDGARDSRDTAGFAKPQSLRDRIRHAINCTSAENESDTPDFILADYLMASLDAFDAATRTREKWYGRERKALEVDLASPEQLHAPGDPSEWMPPAASDPLDTDLDDPLPPRTCTDEEGCQSCQ